MNRERASRSVVQLVSANVAVKLIGIVAIAVFARSLTKDELALLPVYEMLCALAPTAFGFGVQPMVIRTLPGLLEREPGAARRLVEVSTTIQVLGAALFAALVFLAAAPLARLLLGDPERAGLLRILAAGLFGYALRNTGQYLLWSASRFDRMSLVKIVAAVGRAVFGVGGVVLDGVDGLVWGLVLNELLAVFLVAASNRGLLRLPRTAGASPGRLIRDSLPFYYESYLVFLRNQGDSLIVAAALGPAAMAVYFVARRFPLMLTTVIESLDKVTTTELARRRDDAAALRGTVGKMLHDLALVAVPVVFLVIGLLPVLIRALAGPGFEGAVIPGLLLCLAQLMRVIGVPVQRCVFVRHRPAVRVRLTTLEAAVLIGGLWLLTAPWGAAGVAASRALAVAAALAGGLLVLQRAPGVTFPWRRLAVSAVVSTPLAVVAPFGGRIWDGAAATPVLALGGVLAFLLLTAAFQSEPFYGALDELAPFRVRDPVRRLFR